jgi:hypothetical protein
MSGSLLASKTLQPWSQDQGTSNLKLMMLAEIFFTEAGRTPKFSGNRAEQAQSRITTWTPNLEPAENSAHD